MKEQIRMFSALFLDELPYSDELYEARRIIEKKLEEEAGDASAGELIARYGSLEKLAALGGFPADAAARWRSTESLPRLGEVKRDLRLQRWRSYGVAAFFPLALTELIWTVYNIITGDPLALANLGVALLLTAAAFFLLRRFRKIEREHADARYGLESFNWLRDKADQYAKRMLNAVALLIGALLVFGGWEMNLSFTGNSKSLELAERFFSNLYLVLIPLFLLIKNTLLVRMAQNRVSLPEKERYRRHLRGMAIFSAAYWLLAAGVTVLLRNWLKSISTYYLLTGAFFGLLVLLYNLELRKRVTYRNLVINRRRIALAAAVLILVGGFTFMSRETFYTQPYINSLPVVEHPADKIEYNEETGVYTITAAEEDFRILHLTDIHLGGSLFSYRKDHLALAACYALIEYTHPDLVIVTGDLSFPLGIMSLSFNNSAPVYQFASFMRNLGVPWAFTYGNHDTESMASLNQEELNSIYMSLSFKSSRTLLYPYVQPEAHGRNNQLIELRNADGSLNTGLFLIDSNAYTGEGINVYDYIHDDQVDWYAGEVERMNAEAGRTVPSMIFFHIPLQQYRTAYELYEAGSDQVTYFFGENGETMINKVCCSDHPSSLFDRARELGSTTAMFCGHDHYNNISLEYQGIRLTYGMSIDYLAMPGIENSTVQRGGELITIHPDGSWDLEQIPLTSITG